MGAIQMKSYIGSDYLFFIVRVLSREQTNSNRGYFRGAGHYLANNLYPMGSSIIELCTIYADC